MNQLFNYGGETPEQLESRRRFEEEQYEMMVRSIMEARAASSAQAAAAAAGGGRGKIISLGQFSLIQCVVDGLDTYQYIIIDSDSKTSSGLIDSGISLDADTYSLRSIRLKGFLAQYQLGTGQFLTQFITTDGQIIEQITSDYTANYWLDGKDDSGRLVVAEYNIDPKVLYYFDGSDVSEVARQTDLTNFSISWNWDITTAAASSIITITDAFNNRTYYLAKGPKLTRLYTYDDNSTKYAFPLQYNFGDFVVIVEEFEGNYTGLKFFNLEGVLIEEVDLVGQYGTQIFGMNASFYGTNKLMIEFISDSDGEFGNSYILINYDYVTGLSSKVINRDRYPLSSSHNLEFWFGNPYYNGEGVNHFTESAIAFYWNTDVNYNSYCFAIAGCDIKAVYIFDGETEFTEHDLVNSEISSVSNVTGVGNDIEAGAGTALIPDITNSVNGTGATFNVETDGSGNYVVTVENAGTGYRPGDSFVILGSRLLGGTDIANTLIFTVDEIWDGACVPSANATGADYIYVPANLPGGDYGYLSTIVLYKGGTVDSQSTGVSLYGVDEMGNDYTDSGMSNYQMFGEYLSYMIQGSESVYRKYLVIDSNLNTVGFLDDEVYGRYGSNSQRVAYNTLLVREWGGLGRHWVWTPNTEGFYQFSSQDDDGTFFSYRTYQADDNIILSDKMLILDRNKKKFRLISESGISEDVLFTEPGSGSVLGVGLGSSLLLCAYYNDEDLVTVKIYDVDLNLLSTTVTSGNAINQFILAGDRNLLTVYNTDSNKYSIWSFYYDTVIELGESLNIINVSDREMNSSDWYYIYD